MHPSNKKGLLQQQQQPQIHQYRTGIHTEYIKKKNTVQMNEQTHSMYNAFIHDNNKN